jgi:hypothetical protein
MLLVYHKKLVNKGGGWDFPIMAKRGQRRPANLWVCMNLEEVVA